MDFEELKENLKNVGSTTTGLVTAIALLVGEFGYTLNIPPDKLNKVGLAVMALYLVFGVGGKKKE